MLCDHGYPMTGSRSLPLMRVFGIRVGVNYSWFLVLFVVIFILWDSLSETLDASDTTVYVVAVVAAASFFASILLHELGPRAGGAARGDRGRRDRPVPVRRRDEDEPRDRLARRRVPRRGCRPAGDAGADGARLRRGDPDRGRRLVLGRREPLVVGRRLAGRGRRLAARLDEPGAAAVQPRAGVPARRRPDRARRGVEADRRPPPRDALRGADRDRLRLDADRARAAADRAARLATPRSTRSGSRRSAGCSPRPPARRSRRPRSPSSSPGSRSRT